MASSSKALSKAVVWIILLLLIVGLAGFGATSFGGSVREVGSVGDTAIGADRYANALQQEIASFEAQTGQRLTFAEAREAGLDQIVLRRLLALAALEDEAQDLALSVGDEQVRRDVLRIPAFQGLDGTFDREAYEFALDRAGQTVAEFEESLRSETARTLLQGALVAGILPPDIFVDTLYDYARETRDVTLVSFGPGDLDTPIPAPTDAQIEAFYDANPKLFTLPQRRALTYAWLTPDMLTATVEVDEATLRRAYDERLADFVQPERRLVERLVFADDAAARQAADAIAAGETTFDDLVAERGLSSADTDLGEVSRDDLGDAADAVFAAPALGIAGPAPTPLGPALFRVNGTLGAQETTFEQAREDLRAEYAVAAARRAIEEEVETVEDLLASGATLEEVAQETPLELGQTVWSAEDAGLGGADIDAYEEFRERAAGIQPGDFPEVEMLADGGIFALHLDRVIEPEVQPLADVEVRVIEAWEAAERRAVLRARAERAAEALADGADPATLGGTARTETDLGRDAFLEDLPVETVTAAFAMAPAEVRVLDTADGALTLRLDRVQAPDGDSVEAREVKDVFRAQTGQGIAEDVTGAFVTALQAQKGITLNAQAVNAVNAQFN
ncbi:hypothetical protein OCGS_2220 [Oceaniovalibus guishaninsula JLT2003]|uniref:PpiC domain-containing protein n=1 Tax=Oceaniovalibus guishaninsula JLT2003 TaxID=1231392 RepID=K2H790_9RHOB|nr:peptidylprolyl isomerase [Oceaniovalibus guishaninsula]EKE43488.1 hypothetical protein OCGS_2220 [Oceaniovalibus guishaninsula JLT2003]